MYCALAPNLRGYPVNVLLELVSLRFEVTEAHGDLLCAASRFLAGVVDLLESSARVNRIQNALVPLHAGTKGCIRFALRRLSRCKLRALRKKPLGVGLTDLREDRLEQILYQGCR